MISVIIPTLFKVERIYQTLQELSECSEVGEIILIDNTTTHHNFDIPKLKYILETENTYVNPAWNKGAKLAKYSKLCFLSDDVWFDWNHLSRISRCITKNNGMIGMSTQNFNTDIENPRMKRIIPNPLSRNRPSSFACCFFMHKKSYIEIPSDLKIWCGDDWLFYKSENNFVISGIKCRGHVSATSNMEEFEPTKIHDMDIMRGLINSGQIVDYFIGTGW